MVIERIAVLEEGHERPRVNLRELAFGGISGRRTSQNGIVMGMPRTPSTAADGNAGTNRAWQGEEKLMLQLRIEKRSKRPKASSKQLVKALAADLEEVILDLLAAAGTLIYFLPILSRLGALSLSSSISSSASCVNLEFAHPTDLSPAFAQCHSFSPSPRSEGSFTLVTGVCSLISESSRTVTEGASCRSNLTRLPSLP
jgi:hypothetical protein